MNIESSLQSIAKQAPKIVSFVIEEVAMSDLLARAWEPIGKKILERLGYCIDFKNGSFSSAKSFSHKAWVPNSHFDDLIESQWLAVESQCREYVAKAYDRGWNEEGRHPFAEGKAGRIAAIDSFEKEHVVDVLMLMVREAWEQACNKAVLPRIRGTIEILRDLDALSKRVKAKKADLSEADKKLMALAAEFEQADMERAIRAAVLDNAKAEMIKQMQDYARQNPATMGITNEATAKSHHFGFLDWAKANGIGYYQVNAVLDGKTCKSCAAINGKKFKVEDALKFKEKYLDCLGDKDALKSLTPYIKPSELSKVKGLTDAEIIADAKAHPHPKPTPPTTPPPPPAPQAPPKPVAKPKPQAVEKPKPKEPEPQKPVAQPKEKPKPKEPNKTAPLNFSQQPKATQKILPDPSKQELEINSKIDIKNLEYLEKITDRYRGGDKSNKELQDILSGYMENMKVVFNGKEIATAKIADDIKVPVPVLNKEITTTEFIEKYKNAKISDFKEVSVKNNLETSGNFDDYTFYSTRYDKFPVDSASDLAKKHYYDKYGRDTLTFDQYAAIDQYKAHYYGDLRRWALHNFYPDYVNPEHASYQEWCGKGFKPAVFDNHLQTSYNVPAPVNVLTHRGMGCVPNFLKDAVNKIGGDPKKLVGNIYQSDTFMSSSLSPGTAKSFGDSFKIEIFIPKGAKGARYLDCCGACNSIEYEYLLKRGAHFKVLEVNGGMTDKYNTFTSVTLLLLE